MKQLNKDVIEYKLSELEGLINLTLNDTPEQINEKFSTLSNYWVIGWVDPETKKARITQLFKANSTTSMLFTVWWRLKVNNDNVLLYAFSDTAGKPIYDKEIVELTTAERLKSIL